MIDALPTPPAATDPRSVFNTRMYAWIQALSGFQAQANQLEANASTAVTAGTSSTSNSIGTGTKTFTTQSGKMWAGGMYVAAIDTANPTNYMVGQVSSYSGTELVMNSTTTNGSGTKTSWFICMAGAPGPQGPSGSLSGASLSGSLNYARATVASAATTADIWGAAGNQINWTGTTTCTGFPNAAQAGAERVLIIAADGAAFTAGANMLIEGLASGSTVTLAANDEVTVRAVTTSQFLLSIRRYNGRAVNGVDLPSKSGDYTFALADANAGILHPASDSVTPRAFTIPANASVPFPVGTSLLVINQLGASSCSVAITSDLLVQLATNNTGTRTVPANNMLVAIKIAATVWVCAGTGGVS